MVVMLVAIVLFSVINFEAMWLNLIVRWLHIITGIAWIGANPDQAKDIEKKYLGFNTPVRPDWNVEISGEDFNSFVDLNMEFGVMKKRTDANTLVWKQK